ncbi:helix-turn-helix domain-containing protein [Clostridium botulinum]|uniref:helix-turn-helix domain-containing protein n=1 Tax=Clostridium botulinum TaxID=1491 RepID=UPI0026C8234D
MTENLHKHYTLDQLSKEFDIPLTSMKICFKNVYGNSIFAYMRFYRINMGAVLLRQNKGCSIAEIAGKVGYDSPSKFSTAFKDVMGVSPLIYRKNSI